MKPDRSPQIDLLRGIAVLAVLLFHYPYFGFFRIGWAGVDLISDSHAGLENTVVNIELSLLASEIDAWGRAANIIM